MCGFAGEFLLGPGRADLALARRMAARLAHRGPDETGSFLSADGRCAMGFSRLSVIDPAASQQPMSSDDGNITVAFNGEIYNFRQLRRDLAADGAVFHTQGDTEVLPHLYRRHGPEMLHRLDGMFALVIYDRSAGALFLARDRLGQKPLWYAPLDDRIVFASQAKALLLHPAVDTTLDLSALTFYLTMGYIPGPASAFRGLRKLAPAHYMTVGAAPAPPVLYWSPAPGRAPGDPAAAAATVRHSVLSAVRARMAADVPLGALLSGNINSSIVVAAMCLIAGRARGVRTFTAGFEQAPFDERPAARRLARHCGTDHTELLVQPDLTGAVDLVVSAYDEPFADSSALPTFLICREARRHVTVALAGDGGDEVFAGYDRYRAVRLADVIGPGRYLLARLAARLLGPLAPHNERNPLRRFLRFAHALPYPPATQYFMHRRLFSPDDLRRLLAPEFLETVDVGAPASWFVELYEATDLDCEVARAQRHDMLTYLPDDLLVKSDIASMASSLELRSPFLDHRVVSLGLSLPAGWKIRGRRGKAILRDAFADTLPPEVLRRPKRGFAVPLGDWLRNELLGELKETLLDPSPAEPAIFRRQALLGLINDHVSGRADHRHRLWALLVLGRWLARQHA